MTGDAEQLIPHLLRFSDEHREEARSLQEDLSDFRTELQAALDEIWPTTGAAEEDADVANSAQTASSWASRMEERRRDKENAIRRIVKPTLAPAWHVDLLDV